MSKSETDFEHSIADLHFTAGNINGGLQKVLGLLETIITDNTDILSLSNNNAHRDDDSAAVIDSFGLIKNHILDISNFSQQFDAKIAQYSDEIVELKVELEQNKKDALIDPLTGIANRRRFEQVLTELMEDMKEIDGHMAVLLGDIDDFKEVNDTNGHTIGDQVLKLVAHSFAANLKKGDFVARWGGDEFAAILPKIKPKDAITVANRVRDTISSKNIRKKDSKESLGTITLSFGITAHRTDDTVESLIERADKAMYQAKHSGKNKVSTD
ncbi:MAG: GGDEF domain-containing protein [Rhodospirillales bacterium]|nr:GGDEF domain-containing protein [Rhodospirillales bacterium]